jgi:hypothetical protein
MSSDVQARESDRPCAVCGDHIDVLGENYFRLSEENRPVAEADDADFEDFFSRNWLICWPCVYTKLGLVDSSD